MRVLLQLKRAQTEFKPYDAPHRESGMSRQAFDTCRTDLVAAKQAAAAVRSQRKAAEPGSYRNPGGTLKPGITADAVIGDAP